MAEDFENFKEDFTTCAICLDTFTNPKMLPCMHSFCLKCLEDFSERSEMNGDTARCPKCRADMPQDKDAMKNLPTNFMINRLMEIKSPSVETTVQYCDSCMDREEGGPVKKVAEKFCVDCDEKLCEECIMGHRKVKVSRDHVLVGLDQKGEMREALKRKSAQCAAHSDMVLDMYCETCSTAVCMKCCLLSHKDHTNINISEAALRARSNLSGTVVKVKEQVATLTQAVELIEQKREKVRESYETMQDTIEERAQAVIDQIEAYKEEVLEKLTESYDEANAELDNMLGVKNDSLGRLEDFLKLCVELTEKGTDTELVAMSGNMIKNAGELCSSKEVRNEEMDFTQTFKPGTTNRNIAQRVKNLFGVVSGKQNTTGKDNEPCTGEIKEGRKSLSETPTEEKSEEASAKAAPKKKNRNKNKKKAPGSVADEVESIDTCSVVSNKLSTPENSDDEGSVAGSVISERGQGPKTYTMVKAIYGYAVGQPGSKPIQGVVTWNGKIYIARNATSMLDVHDAASTSRAPERQIQIPGLTNATDMVLDISTGNLFIGDWSTSTILKIKINLSKPQGFSEIVKLRVAARPNGLCLTADGTIIVASTIEMKFFEYRVSGELIREVSTNPHKPRHVVKISQDRFIMASGDDKGYVISKVDIEANGNMRIGRQFGAAHAPVKYRLKDARHMTLDGRNDLLYLACSNDHRVLALRIGNLHQIGEALVDETKIFNPSRLSFDAVNGKLCVGCLTGQLANFSIETSQVSVQPRARGGFRGGYRGGRGGEFRGQPAQRRGRGRGPNQPGAHPGSRAFAANPPNLMSLNIKKT